MVFINMFFSWFSAQNNDDVILPWVDLNRLDQLDSIIKESEDKIIVISEESANLYYLDIFRFRDLSNEIALRFGVVHESPQIIVIKGGMVIHHASHNRINAKKINEFVSADS